MLKYLSVNPTKKNNAYAKIVSLECLSSLSSGSIMNGKGEGVSEIFRELVLIHLVMVVVLFFPLKY